MTMLCATCHQPATTLYADGLFSGRCERCARKAGMRIPKWKDIPPIKLHQRSLFASVEA